MIGLELLKYWWVFLIALIILGVGLAYNHQCNRADTAEEALEVYRIAEAKQVAVNEVKHTVAVSNDKQADSTAKADITRLKLDRDRETKNLKELYENRLNSTVADFNYRMQLADTKASDLPEGNTNTRGLTESERDSNTIIAACQLTTVDYNRIRAWADNVCLTVGCE